MIYFYSVNMYNMMIFMCNFCNAKGGLIWLFWPVIFHDFSCCLWFTRYGLYRHHSNKESFKQLNTLEFGISIKSDVDHIISLIFQWPFKMIFQDFPDIFPGTLKKSWSSTMVFLMTLLNREVLLVKLVKMNKGTPEFFIFLSPLCQSSISVSIQLTLPTFLNQSL